MRLNGRRSSSNVEDRRGISGGKVAGIGGIGGLIVTALIIWLAGGNPLEVLNQSGGLVSNTNQVQSTLSPEKEKEYEEFAKVLFDEEEE